MPDRRDDDRDEKRRPAPGARSSIRVARDEDGGVEALREGASPNVLRELRSRKFRPERRLDLHGLRSHEAVAELAEFIVEQFDRGAQDLLVIHGKGLHSAEGIAVLRDAVVAALAEGKLAPYVLGFATAHDSIGGRGATAIRLR
jgi:DNA-nicking Smr family endonuclease